MLQSVGGRFYSKTLSFHILDRLMEKRDRPACRIASVRSYIRPQKCRPFGVMLQYDLVGMQRQVQFDTQKFTQPRNKFAQIIATGVDDIEIVDITPVMPAPQHAFYELIQLVEIDVAEQLRGQVADRKSDARRCFQQAFRRRQPVPIRQRADYPTVLHRVAEQRRANQEIDQLHVEMLYPAGPAFIAFAERAANNIVKYPFVDTHEIASQIEFEYVCRSRVIVRTTADVMFETLNAFERTFLLTARVTVEDHTPFEQWGEIVEQQMMHYSVPKGRGENFALDRPIRNEADTRRGSVCSVPYLVVKYDQVVFQIHLESQLTRRVAFVFSRIVIGLENIGQ